MCRAAAEHLTITPPDQGAAAFVKVTVVVCWAVTVTLLVNVVAV
jgi:hypothetical protein